VDRWGLANVTLKKFTLKEWFANQAATTLKRMEVRETTEDGDERIRYTRKLSLLGRLKAIREAKLSLRLVPAYFEGEVWHCPTTNKIYAIQVWRSGRSADLAEEVIRRCVCH
jgi:hypothetical protein